MKSIIPITILCFLLFFPQIFLAQPVQNQKPWCWTKPVKPDKFPLDTKYGGENWAYCQAGGQASKIQYRVSVDTGNVDTEETTDSYYLTIFGEEGHTNEFLLSNSGFQLGSTAIIKEMALNVGDLTKVRIRTSGL